MYLAYLGEGAIERRWRNCVLRPSTGAANNTVRGATAAATQTANGLIAQSLRIGWEPSFLVDAAG